MINAIVSKFKWIVYPHRFNFRLRQKAKSKNRDWVFARVACMGQDVFKLMKSEISFYNTQKGRVDYLVNLYQNNGIRARTSKVVNFMNRKDIIPLITQQEIFNWEFLGIPKVIYMDSFSELTDQFFLNRNAPWGFCANHSDLDHTEKFKNQFIFRGLLPVEEIESHYRSYFNLLLKKFPDTPIIFLHFPIKLDKREKFQIRYRYIKNAIETISKEISNLYSIEVDEDVVDWPEEKLPGLEKFPYHYNYATYEFILSQLHKFDLVKYFSPSAL